MIYPLKGVYSNPSLVLGGAAKCIMDEGNLELRELDANARASYGKLCCSCKLGSNVVG